MKRRAYLMALWMMLVSLAAAQDGSFVASADRTTVPSGEQFEVSFTLSGSDMSGEKNFKAPDFGQLAVLSGPNTSTNMQIVNGRVSASMTYTYYLYARQPGKFTIGAASIEYRGTTLRTQPIQIEVVQGKVQPQQKGAQDVQDVGDNLFIRATADKQRIRQGEQLTVTYKLYTRVQVSGYDIAKAPVYQGFWSEEIDQPRQPTVTTEMHEGKQYRVAMIRKTALFPTQSGKLSLAPLEVRCAVQVQSRRRNNDPFDSFFNDPFFSRLQTVEQEFKSNPLTITVDPLPGITPPDFSGAVGSYALNASVDKKEVKTGDPITLRLVVSGTGNVKLLSLPKPVLPADVEAYEPKISEEITREGGVIRGRKTAEYLIIPRNAGQRTIEAISFTYFDLAKNAFSTLRSPRFDLSITPGKDVSTGTSIASKSDIKMLGEDIRFLKLSLGEVHRVDESPFETSWFAGGLLFPPLAFIGAYIYRRRLEKLSGNVRQLRFQKAGKEAAKRLKHAKKILAQGNTESYHSEISKALMGYLEDKLHIPRATLSLEEAVLQLQRGGVSDQITDALKSCIERSEFARFAPGSDTMEARTELLESAASTIDTIERQFKK